MKKNILITGGTGLIGQRLIEFMGAEKFNFRILSRSRKGLHSGVQYYNWNPSKYELDTNALEGVDVIINLAGAGIADKKWSPKRKELIVSSRLDSIKTLKRALSESHTRPKLIIGASAVGYYGDRGNKKLVEQDGDGEGFLANVCRMWEEEYQTLNSIAERMLIIRIGIVLSTKGGALKEFMKTSKLGVYGYFGNGEAIYPWIHIDDICKIIKDSLEIEDYSGTLNAVSPNPVTIKELIISTKKALDGIGIVAPVPIFLLKMALGEMQTVLTNSTNALPAGLNNINHQFYFDDPTKAINDLLNKKI